MVEIMTAGMAKTRIRSHTLAFGTYLAIMAVALSAAGVFTFMTFYSVLLATLAWLTWRSLASPSQQRSRHECLFYALAMNMTFPAMGAAIPAVRTIRYDKLLIDVDRAVFSVSPNVWAEQFITPMITEVMSLCYLFFMPLLFVNLVRYFFSRKELLDDFYRGLFTVYGVGFVGYLLVPAAGPYLAYPELFSVPLQGGTITTLTQAMVKLGSNKVDVFPSLHCAVSAYILGFAYRHHRKEFWWLLAPIVGLWMATIYLRYHYLVDVAFGFALALCSLMFIRLTNMPSDRST